MSVENTKSFSANVASGTELAADRVVTFTNTGVDEISQVTATTNYPAGISNGTSANGVANTVEVYEFTGKLEGTSGGTFGKSAILSYDADGKLVAASTGDYIIGQALEASTAENQTIEFKAGLAGKL